MIFSEKRFPLFRIMLSTDEVGQDFNLPHQQRGFRHIVGE
jgi:hypothetical protein